MSVIFSAILAVAFTLVLCVYAWMTDPERPRAVSLQPAHGEPDPRSTRSRREAR